MVEGSKKTIKVASVRRISAQYGWWHTVSFASFADLLKNTIARL